MRNALVADGYVQGEDLYYYVAQGRRHNEASWAARVHIPLTYLFPWQSASSPPSAPGARARLGSSRPPATGYEPAVQLP